jgi:uncharacterized membrane protein
MTGSPDPPSTEKPMSAPRDPPLFEDTLTPHRSLSRRGFRVLMIVTFCATTALSVPFYLLGAWPIVGFLGLDVLAIYLAFRANFHAARACEHFRLTYFELTFARISAAGARREWRLTPAWVRLERVDDEEYGPQRLTLHSRGHCWQIARNVGPDRKAEFAGAFARALSEARSGPRYS